ncbi:hypothetical protein CDAR_33921 [Caerostris darwini]|uniref:Uncharacterized protein n=1 Tax=Caerostris darwini TaxID=1538125 RepID=A0AAV4UZ50_9ARAC|nr:hypothetical protein CDAR_33921 [Caerostris darwini]
MTYVTLSCVDIRLRFHIKTRETVEVVLTVYGGGCACAGEHYPVCAEQPCYDAANDPEPPASTSARGHVDVPILGTREQPCAETTHDISK